MIGMLAEQSDKLLIFAFMDKEACRGNAHLAGVEEFLGDQHLRKRFDVYIIEDDNRGMAAQLHRDRLHNFAGFCRQQFAHRRGSGKGDLANGRSCNQLA